MTDAEKLVEINKAMETIDGVLRSKEATDVKMYLLGIALSKMSNLFEPEVRS